MIKKSLSELFNNLSAEHSDGEDNALRPTLIGNHEAEQVSGGDRDYIPMYESISLSKSTFDSKTKMLLDGTSA